MEVDSAQISVSGFQKYSNALREIFESPKQSTFFLLGISLLLAILFASFFAIKQNFAASSQLKKETDERILTEKKSVQEAKTKKYLEIKQIDTTRTNDLKGLKKQLEAYYQSKGYYPQSLNNLVPNFIGRVPVDPETGDQYYYICQVDQKGFVLKTQLSDGSEIELTNN